MRVHARQPLRSLVQPLDWQLFTARIVSIDRHRRRRHWSSSYGLSWLMRLLSRTRCAGGRAASGCHTLITACKGGQRLAEIALGWWLAAKLAGLLWPPEVKRHAVHVFGR